MDVAGLPPLLLMLADRPSDSGRIHAPVRKLWEAGNTAVRTAMAQVAELADAGRYDMFVLAARNM